MSENTALFSLGTLAMIVLLGLAALGLWGCPRYAIYSEQMSGRAALAKAQTEELVVTATARGQNEAATQFADATSQRVNGWVSAAQSGCAKLGLPGDRQCEQYLISEAQLYSIAKEGDTDTHLVVGTGTAPTVAVGAR